MTLLVRSRSAETRGRFSTLPDDGWWMPTRSCRRRLDKEASADCDIYAALLCSYVKRGHAARLGAVAAVTKALRLSPLHRSSLSSSSSYSSSSSSVSQRGVVVTTYRKNWSDPRRLAATRVASWNILWGGPLRNTRIFERTAREKSRYAYFKRIIRVGILEI